MQKVPIQERVLGFIITQHVLVGNLERRQEPGEPVRDPIARRHLATAARRVALGFRRSQAQQLLLAEGTRRRSS